MQFDTDVFVIGGGPVGLAAAIAARRNGLAVTVADGARPPIDKACGEGLMPDALAALRELGVELSAGDGVMFRGIRFVAGAVHADGDFHQGPAVGLRRTILHERLVERALQCGAELRWNTPVTGISEGGVTAGGHLVRARWIIGADGSGSRVRRWSGLDEHKHKAQRYAVRRHYRVKPWVDRVEIHWARHLQAYVTPTAADEVAVAVLSSTPRVSFGAALAQLPELAERLGTANIVSRERVAVTMMLGLRRVQRGNVALLGDASGGVDAITGEGLRLGFQQALSLADALADGDLSAYEFAHRRIAKRPSIMARMMLLMAENSSLRHRVFRMLHQHPAVFERLIAVHLGETSPAHLAATGALLGWHFLAA